MGALDHTAAYDPFFDEVASVGGTRLEAGAAESRAALLAVPVCVIGGASGDSAEGSVAPNQEALYTVLIRRSDWKDHKAPQTGDTLTISGRPLMRVAHVESSPTGWELDCRSREEAP